MNAVYEAAASYAMYVMWAFGFAFLSSRFRDIQKSAKSQIYGKVAFRQEVKEQISFQDRKKENTPIFPSIEI